MAKEELNRPPSYILLIVYKFFAGFIELTTGILFGIFGQQFRTIYQSFQLAHLREDSSLYVRTIEHAIPFLLDHRSFVIAYFLTLGLGTIIGAVGLWYEKVWAIHMMIVLSAILVPFEFIDFVRRPTIFLFAYMLFNISIIVYLARFNPHVSRVLRKHKKIHPHDSQTDNI
ncbi:hypothetical protein C5B42_04550 [Candidatus Cerribacteria bacterium 'Amazon FNV 2010 28 9']|uniref:DUF2127 domain-containing protein n=1 Tax=Candidatus Cerribacteria bacterium 'Amazon FNV 2010 28 9' TaxID=2081795 RepID=A0A317JQN4_9BACT|nr:MAG: hypothetical protein C5B42_04550 [Candidatus Cerribacteria bacterium 'Amazon FNV 2010 28 9']